MVLGKGGGKVIEGWGLTPAHNWRMSLACKGMFVACFFSNAAQSQ